MPRFHRLLLPAEMLSELIAHARDTLPNECCGLAAGLIRDEVAIATVRFAIRNDAASPREYFSNPRDMLAAHRSMREQGLELLAIYHSHPTTTPVPSARDLEQNAYGNDVLHLIVSLASVQPALRVWRLGEDDYEEVEWAQVDRTAD
jgi:proteasome lid subunit RPN8/RPN11